MAACGADGGMEGLEQSTACEDGLLLTLKA